MKILFHISYFYFFILLATEASGQAAKSPECYLYTSKYYQGDFIKICFQEDSSFTYLRHQNDVIGDYYSKGIWKKNADTIILLSTKPELPAEIIKTKDCNGDSITITIVDSILNPIQYAMVSMIDSNNKLIAGAISDNNGWLTLKRDTNSCFLKFETLGFPHFLLDINSINFSHLKIIYRTMDRFKEMSGLKLIKPDTKTLKERTVNGTYILYHLEK